MKPQKLSMSAFGCYANKEEIDFTQLGDEGLYLIAGDNGAGKTTIFDAVTFALYGKPSGDNREPGMLRSKYAKPDMETSVEFFFNYHGKDYRIKRSPAYERAKQRGDGLTMQQADATLYLPEGRTIARLTEVDKKIVEILGLTRDQFVQIAMIAQGEFLKVLHASTEERMEIFRNVFYTDKYKRFQDRVKKDTAALAVDIKQEKDSYNFYLGNAQVDEDDADSIQKLAEAKKGLISSKDTLEWLATLIETDRNTSSANGIVLDGLNEKLGVINQSLGQAEQDKKARASLQAAKDRLPIEQAALIEEETALNAKKARQPELEAVKAQIAEIQASLPKYQQLQSLIDAISANKDKLATEKQKVIDLTGKQKTDDAALKAAKTGLKTLEDVAAIIEGLNGKKNTLMTRQTSLTSVQTSLTAYDKLIEDLKDAQEGYTGKAGISAQLRNEYERLNRAYLDEQAGVLG
jgi:exonuclease SbcC